MIDLRQRHRTENGFTLIELLVVIIILGILSAVVVFAVRGVGDKGKGAAFATDAKTIRTAQEAYCAKAGHYATMDQLTGAAKANDGVSTYKFLSEASEYHKLSDPPPPGACNGTGLKILCMDDTDPPCETDSPSAPTKWEPTAAPPPFVAQTIGGRPAIQLLDGKVLIVDRSPDDRLPKSYLYDPASTTPWSAAALVTVGVPNPQASGVNNLVLLKPADGDTCGTSCGNVFTHVAGVSSVGFDGGHYAVFDPDTGAWVGNKTARYNRGIHGYGVLLTGGGDPVKCRPHCGKVLIMGQHFATEANLPYCPGQDCFGQGAFTYNPPVAELYNPATSTFEAVDCPYGPANDFAQVGYGPVMVELPDGRVMAVGHPRNNLSPRAVFFNPNVAVINNDLGTIFGPTSCRSAENPWMRLSDPGDPDVPLGAHQADSDDAVVLPDGRIFLSGGKTEAEIYNPSEGQSAWATVPSTTSGDCSALVPCNILGVLPSGKVLVNTSSPRSDNPGYDGLKSRTATYLFNPDSNTFEGTVAISPDGKSGGAGAYLEPPQGACSVPSTSCNYGKVLAVGDHQASLYTP